MINIAFNIDSKYVPFCRVLIQSILNYNSNVSFHILHSDLKSDHIEELNQSVINADINSLISFYHIDDNQFSHMPKSSQWPTTIYYRLMIANFLSNEIEKVLYLDCDILVRGSLEPLFDTCLDGFGIAAVEDVLSPIAPMIESINADPLMGYFNSGVMLINLKYWRDNDIVDKTIEFINNNLKILQHPDQDALNSVLNKSRKKLHYKWNFLKNYQNIYFRHEYLEKDVKKISLNYPIIVHFSGVKPWTSKCRSIFKYEYHEVMRQVGMSKMVPKPKLLDRFELLIVKMLDIFGLKRCRVNYFV